MEGIERILRAELKDLVEADRKQHLGTPSGSPVYAINGDPLTDSVQQDLDIVDSLLSDLREARANRDTSATAARAAELVERHGLDPDREQELALDLISVHIEAMKSAREHVLRGPSRYRSFTSPEAPRTVIAEVPERDPGPTFGGSSSAYCERMRGEWKPQTLSQNATTYRMFVDAMGDLPVNKVTRKDVAGFLDLLQCLPSLWSKNPKWRGWPLREIVEDAGDYDGKFMAAKTVSRHLSALGGLFDDLKARGEYEGENPAHGQKARGAKSAERGAWDSNDLSKLLEAPNWIGCRGERYRAESGTQIIADHKYWLPLLALYHGARLEELAQLRRRDVKEEDGEWVLDINSEDENQLKNDYSIRLLPLHSRLVDLRFLDYVESVTELDHDPVFPRMKPGGKDGKLGHGFSKWFGEFRAKLGIQGKPLRQDFHALRHTTITKLVQAGTPKEVIHTITGHEQEGTALTVYSHATYPMQTLRQAIQTVQYPEDRIKPHRGGWGDLR